MIPDKMKSHRNFKDTSASYIFELSISASRHSFKMQQTCIEKIIE